MRNLNQILEEINREKENNFYISLNINLPTLFSSVYYQLNNKYIKLYYIILGIKLEFFSYFHQYVRKIL